MIHKMEGRLSFVLTIIAEDDLHQSVHLSACLETRHADYFLLLELHGSFTYDGSSSHSIADAATADTEASQGTPS